MAETSVPGETPGAVLARARAEARLSVEDVAAATRIRAALIRSIEADEYDRLGGEVYARGHIRSVAHAVGIADAEPLVAAYESRYGKPVAKLTAAPISTIGEPVREVTRKATKTAPKWPAVAIGVLALVVVLLAVSWVVGRGQDKGRPQASQPTTPIVTTTPPATTAPPTTTPPPAKTTPAVSGVVLRLSVKADSSWVRVTSSQGKQVFEGVLPANATQQFTDPEGLAVRFGRGDLVTVTLNGRTYGRACAVQVCSQTYPRTTAQDG